MFGVEVKPPPPPRAELTEKSDRPAHESFYTVAGRSLCVTAAEEWAARLFATHFSGWHFSPPQAAGGTKPDALIAVRTGQRPPVPAAFDSFDVAEGGRCHTDGRTYFFEVHGSLVRVSEQATPLVEVWVGREAPAREAAALARLVFNAASSALRRCGLFELHGGGVVEPSTGAGALFIGPSGSGKSTLTMQLAGVGWRYLSDDTLLLGSGGGDAGVAAWALRRAFAVTGPTIAASKLEGLDSLTTSPVPFDPLKRRFEPEKLFPGGFARSCAPRALVFPTVTHEPASSAEQLSQSATMARLLKMCPWSCYDRPAAREHLGLLSRLARQAVAFDLRAGRDLLGDFGRTAALVGSLLRGEK
jgi:hypothetical protein